MTIFDALYQWDPFHLWWYVPLGVIILSVLLKAGYELWKETEEAREKLEKENKLLKRELLQKFLDKIEAWVLSEDNPLAKADCQDPRCLVGRTEALATLETQGPSGKRRLLETMWTWRLIDKSSFVINLNCADLSGVDLTNLHPRRVKLDFTCLRDADLTGATLSRFEVSEAGFEVPTDTCSLLQANLSGAVLKDTRLAGCNMHGADFKGANLEGADLRNTTLRDAHNLTQEQIDQAYGSCGQQRVPDTKLPTGLKAPEVWCKSIDEQRRVGALLCFSSHASST